MQHNPKSPQTPGQKRNRYSKILIVVIGVLIALVALIVGGTLAEWDIVGFLKSPMAILIYFIVGAVAVFAILHKIMKRRY